VFRVAGRPTRPLAKAPLFDQRLLGSVLRALGGLPVYRRQDDPSQMFRNQDTFRAAIDALQAGDALQIYPEGRSHSEPSIEPLRTGAARIALAAEGEREGALGLVIVPIGLTYERKHRFGGRVLAEIGDPFPVTPWLTRDGADDPDAVRALTEEMTEQLRRHTLNLDSSADLELLSAADRIYSRQKALHGHRERDLLADRVPRLRRFAEGLAWLRHHDPDEYRRLAGKVHRVDRVSRALGAETGGIPRRYPLTSVIRYTFLEGLTLLVGLPLALVGSLVWYPAWVIPRFVVARAGPEHESVATYKLATSFFTVPLTILVLGAVGYAIAGVPGGVAALVGTPLLGVVAWAWRERWGRVREDTAIFLRVLTRPKLRERLAQARAELTAEFDRVLRRMLE
jgi:glycerol-3-phosphate O-acyltransferase/dihydroxyacetone phosphate acyltransferase